MDRKAWDRIVSSAGAVLAVILLVLGGAPIYGGNFGQDNVRDRLAPQNISFPPADAMDHLDDRRVRGLRDGDPGLLLGLLAFLGFRHAKRAAPINATTSAHNDGASRGWPPEGG